MKKPYCLGFECSIKHTCLRYTQGKEYNDTPDKYSRKCSSRKGYVQDVDKINTNTKEWLHGK